MSFIDRVLSFFKRPSSPERSGSGQTPPSGVTEQNQEEASPPATSRSGRLIVIGLDYGTHSTKALFRLQGESKTTLLQLDTGADGYPWFASPSLVRRSGGRLFFGSEAAKREAGALHRRLKVQLLPPIQARSAEQAAFHVENGPPADVLVAAYLAWTFTKIRKELDSAFGPEQMNPYIQMAVPVNRNEEWRDSKGRYLRIMQAAWESTFGASPWPGGVENGLEEEALFQWLSNQLEKDPPEKGWRRFHLLPEAGAPIASLSQDPRLVPGVYELVDMGAGTTEYSVGEINPPSDRSHSVQCIYATTIALGADDLNGSTQSEGLDKFVKEHILAWENAYQGDHRGGPKDNAASRKKWHGLTVFKSGGGTLREDVDSRLRQANPINRFGGDPISYQVKKATQIGIVSPQRRLQTDDSVFLACAHGLALHGQQWPRYFTPEQYEAPPRDEQDELPPGWASPRDL